MDVSYASDSTEAPGDNEDGFHHMPSLMLACIDMALFDQEELGKLARCENMQVQEHRLHKYEVPVPEIDKEVFSESRSSELQGFHAVLLDKMEEEEGEGGSSSSSEEENDENDEDFSLSSKSGRGRAQKRIARSVQGEPPKKVQRANQKVINVVGASSSALAATNVEAYVNVHDKSKGKLKAKVGSEEEEEVQIVIGHEFGKVDYKGRHVSYASKSLSSIMEPSTLRVDSGQEVPKKFDFDAHAAHLHGESSQLRSTMGAHIVGAGSFGCPPFKTTSAQNTSNYSAGISDTMTYLDSINAQQSSLLLDNSSKRLKTDKVRGHSSSGVSKTTPIRNEAGLYECLICHKTYLEVSRLWGHQASHRKRRKKMPSSQTRISAKHIATHMQDVLPVTYANSRDVVSSDHKQPSPPPPLQHGENEKVIFSNQHQPSVPLEHNENVVFSDQQHASPSLQHGDREDIEENAGGIGAGNTQMYLGDVGLYQCPTCPKSYNDISRYYGHLSCHVKRKKILLPPKRASKDTATGANDGILVFKDHPKVPDLVSEQHAPAIRKRGRKLLSKKTRGDDVGKPKPKPCIIPNEDGMFQCIICQKTYSEISRYYGHMSCHRVKKISSVQGRKAKKNVLVHPKSDDHVAKAKDGLQESKSAEEQQITLVSEHNAKESIINKSSGNSVEIASSIVGENGPLQCSISQKPFCKALRYDGHIGSHEEGRKWVIAEKEMTMKKSLGPSLSSRVEDSIAKAIEVSDDIIQPNPAAEVDQLGNVHDENIETAHDIIVASTTPALSGSNTPSPVGEIGQLEIQVDDQGLDDNTMAPVNIFQTSLYVGVDSHEIKCNLTTKTFLDKKHEAANTSPNHINGFLKLLGKPTRNQIGGNSSSQSATFVENATKPHSDMKIGGQVISQAQVQGHAVHKDTGCWQCGEPFQNLIDLLFCDWCDREFHSRCVLGDLQPQLKTNWVCPLCEGGR